ncbi:MAG: hypothetical protein ABIP64_11430 [Burkholderiales bacterium]
MMHKKTQVLTQILSALVLTAASVTVFSADEPAKSEPGTSMPQPDKAKSNEPVKTSTDVSAQMKILDPDADGTVSKTEAAKMAGLTEVFDKADKNKDGKLDAGEFATALGLIKK